MDFKEIADTKCIEFIRYVFEDTETVTPPLNDEQLVKEYQDEYNIAMDMAGFGYTTRNDEVVKMIEDEINKHQQLYTLDSSPYDATCIDALTTLLQTIKK